MKIIKRRLNMIKLLLLLTFALPLLSYGQTIDGFGVIKLGKTYLQIIGDLNIKENKIRSEAKGDKISFMDTYSPTNPILLKWDSANTKSNIDYLYTHCLSTYKLLLPPYKVADIEIKNSKLEFLNDTLYSIEVDPSSEFTQAIKTKYGKGVIKTETKKVKCSSAMAAAFEVDEIKYETTWTNENNNIETWSVLSEYRDNECKKKYLSYFIIRDKNKSQLVNNCSSDNLKRIKELEDTERKSKLKDF